MKLSYPRLFYVSSQKENVVAKILSNSLGGLDWNLSFSRGFYDWEVSSVAHLLNYLKDVYVSSLDQDLRIWSHSNGDFSSKSFFFFFTFFLLILLHLVLSSFIRFRNPWLPHKGKLSLGWQLQT